MSVLGRTPRTGVALAAALLLAAPALAGCGEDDPAATSARDASASPSGAPGPPSPSGSRSASASASGSASGSGDLASAADRAVLVSGSNAGGTIDDAAAALASAADVGALTRGIEGPLPEQVRRAWRALSGSVSEDEVVVGAVVDVSCEQPRGVKVATLDDGLTVVALAVPVDRQVQCLVPVTTVALVPVPAGAV